MQCMMTSGTLEISPTSVVGRQSVRIAERRRVMTDLLLPTALLWFDDSDKSLEDKVRQAAATYRHKYGKPPTLCFVHPDALGNSESRPVGGVEVRAGRTILPNDFLIGRRASAEQERNPALVHCPDCPDQGWYADGEEHPVYDGTGELGYPVLVGIEVEAVQVQCEFCWTTPNSYFNHQREKQAEVREHVTNERRQEADYADRIRAVRDAPPVE